MITEVNIKKLSAGIAEEGKYAEVISPYNRYNSARPSRKWVGRQFFYNTAVHIRKGSASADNRASMLFLKLVGKFL